MAKVVRLQVPTQKESETQDTFPGKRTATSLELPEGLSIEQWEDVGKSINRGSELQWWQGDWWCYGGHEYGDRAAAVAKGVFGLSYQTMKVYGWVAEHVERVIRITNLPFLHHQLVAKFDAKDQKKLLAKAVKNEWSASEFRSHIKEFVRSQRQVAPLNMPTDRWKLIHSPVSELHEYIDDDSVDWIITDPPYPEEFLSVYAELSKTASMLLKPGGSCLVMCGQTFLPQVINALCQNLTYHWMAAYLTPGGQATQIWPRRVNNFWKPLIWLTNGPLAGDHWIGDVCKSKENDNDKRFHDWGQSESGMADVIGRFTSAGQTILDPFLGGGTTGVVALQMDRQFIGSDSNAKAIETARLRFA